MYFITQTEYSKLLFSYTLFSVVACERIFYPFTSPRSIFNTKISLNKPSQIKGVVNSFHLLDPLWGFIHRLKS